MNINDRFYELISELKGVNILKNISVKNDNNMRVEAIFEYKIEIYSYKNIRDVFKLIKEYHLPYYILGMGSNILFLKEYYQGVLIKLMPIENKYLDIISSGSSLNYLNSKLINEGIESLNFLTGVPCSIGGAIYMNAGSNSKQMCDIIEYVYYLDLDNLKIKVISNNECNFGYRSSIFKYNNFLILGAKIKLLYKDKEEIVKEHHIYLNKRRERMPLEYPNLGSIFKNPINNYAGKMIESIGIKGLELKGAKISEKHANVIINNKDAKGENVLKLIEIIEDLIYIKYKIKLEREIIIFKKLN